jgi:hypothetical protein
VNFVFETSDLSCASPATVSRMGMIFLSDEDMDAKVCPDIYICVWMSVCVCALTCMLAF